MPYSSEHLSYPLRDATPKAPEPPWFKRPEEQQKVGVAVVLFFIALAAGLASVIWGLFATKILFVLSFGGSIGSAAWLYSHVRRWRVPLVWGAAAFVVTSAALAIPILMSASPSAPSLASSPAPVAPLHFDGTIAMAANLVRPSWDHRVVIMGIRIKNTGALPSKLSDWSVSGTDLKGGQILYGLIIQPLQPVGEKFKGPSNSGIWATITYDAQSYLPNQGNTPLKPSGTIEGVLEVEFARQVDNLSIKIGFHDEKGNPYIIGCQNCQTMP